MLRVLPIALCGLWLACLIPTAASAWSEQVFRAQQRLDALGLSPGPADGMMGPQTQDAIRAFQRKNELPETGRLDWQTQTALSASVRTHGGDPPVPVPRAVPVPAVSIDVLPPPGAEPSKPAGAAQVVAGADTGVESVAPASTGADALGTRAPARQDLVPPAAPADDDKSMLRRARPAILLGAAAAVAWLGLFLWWLRQRARRTTDATSDAPAE